MERLGENFCILFPPLLHWKIKDQTKIMNKASTILHECEQMKWQTGVLTQYQPRPTKQGTFNLLERIWCHKTNRSQQQTTQTKMKLLATTNLVIVIIGSASAALPPGYEDQIWCPKNTCEIYTNPYGIAGADSSLYFCYHPSTGKTRQGIWTGSLTKTIPPANAIQP